MPNPKESSPMYMPHTKNPNPQPSHLGLAIWSELNP